MTAKTLDDVMRALDAVVERAIEKGDRLGYFAAIYRTVTAQVQVGVDTGFFDEPERMERLDALFASRYLDALDERQRSGRPTRSWRVAFDAAEQWRPIVLQHLMVGINAHINLDLGIAAAEAAPGRQLPTLRHDFDRINEILAGLLTGTRAALAEVSPWIGLLDRLGGRHDDEVINFSFAVARSEAWRFATEMAALPADQRAPAIGLRDERVAQLTDVVLRPGWLSLGLLLIRSREGFDVGATIEALTRVPPPPLTVVEARVQEDRPPGKNP